jgi:putative oxidoreductase
MIPPRFAGETFALFRIVFGALFLMHGLQKLVGWFGGLGGQAVPIGSMMGVAGVIECTAGTLILIGLFTRYAAFIASGMMAAAYFMAHFPNGALPIQNGGEPAVMNCFAFLYIAAHGAGIWSVDALRTGTGGTVRRAA